MVSTNSKKRIAFFDVDNTLLEGNSGFYTSLHLVRYGILKQRRFLQAAYYSLASLLFSQNVEKIYEIAIADLAGSTEEHVLQIGLECFEKDIKPRLYPEAIKRIREHQKKGDIVILLTAAPYMLIKNIQDYLGIEEAYSMGPEIVSGILTNRLCMPICHGKGKVHYAELAAKKHGIPLSNCFFYTDDKSDLPLMEKVGKPIAVNPDRELKKVAMIKGWPIYKFRREWR